MNYGVVSSVKLVPYCKHEAPTDSCPDVFQGVSIVFNVRACKAYGEIDPACSTIVINIDRIL